MVAGARPGPAVRRWLDSRSDSATMLRATSLAPPRQPVYDVDVRARRPDPDGRRARAERQRLAPGPPPRRARRAVPGDPRDPAVPQGRLASRRRRASGSLARRPRASRCAGSTSAGPAAARGSPRTSTPRARPRTVTRPSSGWRPSRGRTGTSGCGGSRMAGSRRSRSPSSGRRISGRSSRCTPRDDRYTDDVHYIGGCVTVSELSQYAVSMVGMNALPARPSFRGEALAARSGVTGSSGRRSGCSSGSASSTMARTGDRARWPPTTTAIEAAMLLIAGWMDEYVDPGAADARTLRQRPAPGTRRQLGPRLPRRGLSRPEPRLAPRVRPVLRPLAQGHRQRGDGRARADVLPARLRPARAVPGEPGRARGGASRRSRRPGATETSLWLDARRRAVWPGGSSSRSGSVPTGGGRTGSRTARRPGRGRPCRGAPGRRRTASPGISGSTTPSSRPTRAPPLTEPIEILGFPRRRASAVEASMPVATHRASGCPTSRRTGPPRRSPAGVLNLTHRASHASPSAARARPGVPVRVAAPRSRLPVRAGPSDPAVGRVATTGRSCGRRRSRASWRSIAPARGSSCRRSRPATARCRRRRSRRRPAGLEEVGGGSAEPPVWRILEDVIAGTVTVSTNDAG